MSDIVKRLRGIYRIPVNDGGGLLNGSDTFERRFEPTPIMVEAAAEIEALRARVAELEKLVDDMRDVCVEKIEHRWGGNCPDRLEGRDSRDKECAACNVLMRADAVIKRDIEPQEGA